MKRSAQFAATTAAAVLAAASAPAGEIRKAEIPMVTRLAPVDQVDAEARTVTLTWTTGADVTRYDWWTGQRYIEQLDVSTTSCDLSRLNAGAPLLNSHEVYDLGSVLGVVDRAWIENGVGKAAVRFPKEGINPVADQIFQMVQDKIIQNVSVGYQVRKYQITDNQGDGLDVWRAVDWLPMEISLVTIPADAGAGVRNETDSMHPCEFERAVPTPPNKETTMKPENTPAPENVLSTDEHRRLVAEAQNAERQRGLDIRARVTAAGLPDEVAVDLIGRGIAADHVGNHILDEMAKRGTQTPRPNGDVTITEDETDKRRVAVTEAILHRASPTQFKLTDGGRNYRGMSMLEIGRDLLEARGEKTRGLDKMELAKRSLMTTGDFPNILANVGNKLLQVGYNAEKRTFLGFGKRIDAADFKQISSLQMGEGSDLELVNEHGEFKRGQISEGAEKWNLKTYGKIFGFTRQAMINDDIEAFTSLPLKFGSAGVRLENNIVWGIIIANANMSDGNALYSTAHKNLVSGGTSALAVTGLGLVRKAFRQQKGLDSKQTLNLEMKYIAVCSALETSLEQIMSPLLYAAQSSNVTTDFIRGLVPVVEPRLDTISDTAWFGFTDPSQMESIEYGYLQGSDGVYLETRSSWDIDGVEIKVRHDFGAAASNFRGTVKSAGA